MKLVEVVRNLNSLNDEATIYASEPWTADSEALVAPEPETGDLPAYAKERGLQYFLEVLIAKEFLDGWLSNLSSEPTLNEKCARLIKYAKTDA